MKYLIRYNKSAGEPGRGSADHKWRVFEGEREYLFKNFKVNVPCCNEFAMGDWNLACEGYLKIDRDTSTAIIEGDTP
jgi:hypothetical protein